MDVQSEGPSQLKYANGNNECSSQNESELEPYSLESHCQELEVEATSRRRTHPVKIKSALAEEFDCHLKHLVQCKFAASEAAGLSEGIKTGAHPNTCIEPEWRTKAREAFSTLSSLSKSGVVLLDRAGRIEKSHKLHASMAHCPTQRVMNCPEPEEDKMAASITPLRRRAQLPCRTPPSRITNSLHHQTLLPGPQRSLVDFRNISQPQRRSTRLKQNS